MVVHGFAICRWKSGETRGKIKGVLRVEKIPISIALIVKNEEHNLVECLESVGWAREIVVVDSGSKDKTIEIARACGAKVLSREMDCEGSQRNFALDQVTEDWVLILDADERVSYELSGELREVASRSDESYSGYAIPIKTFVAKRWIKAAGYYPATRLRLVRRGSLRYEEAGVHPRVFFEGKRGFLKGDILHYGYRDISHFVEKLNNQAALEAQKWVGDGRGMSFANMFRKMLDRFSRNYFRKKGITDGFLGFLMSVFHGCYQLFTYSKYLELKANGRQRRKNHFH